MQNVRINIILLEMDNSGLDILVHAQYNKTARKIVPTKPRQMTRSIICYNTSTYGIRLLDLLPSSFILLYIRLAHIRHDRLVSGPTSRRPISMTKCHRYIIILLLLF